MQPLRPLGTLVRAAVHRTASRFAYASVASRPAMSVARICGVRKATVFMFHRFTDGGGWEHGTDITVLRQMLRALRRQGVQFLRLRDLLANVESGAPLSGPTVVCTVDDGYADLASLAAPIFAGFDVSPTVFLVTEFIAGRQWCWWDRITESFLRSPLHEAVLSGSGRHRQYPLGTLGERRAAAASLIEALKWVSDDERLRVLEMIDARLGVTLPKVPPPEYAALTWNAVRQLERTGVDFAPHSLTHPMLSRMRPDESAREIGGSWDVLRNECHDPAPIFGYPNGSSDSFGQREIDTVRDCGMRGAVAFRRRYVNPSACSVADRFHLSRFPAPEDPATAVYLASGIAWGAE